jgi:hypothetical protein
MKRYWLTLFLLLSAVLFGSFAQGATCVVYKKSTTTIKHRVARKMPGTTTQVDADIAVQGRLWVDCPDAGGSSHEVLKMELTELEEREEDETEKDVSALRKHVESGKYTAAFPLQDLDYFFNNGQKLLPFVQHFSYNATYRYLALLVIRI